MSTDHECPWNAVDPEDAKAVSARLFATVQDIERRQE